MPPPPPYESVILDDDNFDNFYYIIDIYSGYSPASINFTTYHINGKSVSNIMYEFSEIIDYPINYTSNNGPSNEYEFIIKIINSLIAKFGPMKLIRGNINGNVDWGNTQFLMQLIFVDGLSQIFIPYINYPPNPDINELKKITITTENRISGHGCSISQKGWFTLPYK